ncbi:MAG: glycerol acyltransferase, partial [Bacteroidales bacterium]
FLGEFYGGKIKVQVNDLLMNVTPLTSVFIPVNCYGGQTKELSKNLTEVFDSDNQIIVFPAGFCSRRFNGVIQDPEWKKWFITSAVQYKRDIVPIYFDGQNSKFFYRLALIRKMLGIKLNIELIYLPDEMFKASNKTFNIYFGKPISWKSFDDSKTPKEWAQEVRSQVYALKNKQ